MTRARLPSPIYEKLRDWLSRHDPECPGIIAWSQSIQPPATPEDLAWAIIQVILLAGRRAQAVPVIEARIRSAIGRQRPVLEAFGHHGKAAAIERAWRDRKSDFRALAAVLKRADLDELIEWCGVIPYVGDVTKFHLAKNLGAQVCKPDIWMSRVAGFPDKPKRPWRLRFDTCMTLCRELAEASGDNIATIDSVIWLACNKRILQVSAEAGPVRFVPGPLRGGPIL